jgi:import inner membrane translocase subunit TIM54
VHWQPILVAAAVDFEMVAGKRHGDLTDRIANEIRLRRRMDLGIDSVSEVTMSLPTYKPLPEARRHALEGGFVIVGRPTLKEFMAGLKRGWTEGLDKVDKEELLARELESDGHFDEPDEPGDDSAAFPSIEKSKLPTLLNSPVYSPLQMRPPLPNSSSKPGSSITESMNMPPTDLPPLPPLLLVTFTNYIGLSQIPIMIWEFFNQRHKVRSGAEAGYRLVMKHTRPFVPPTAEPESVFADATPKTNTEQGDLDFDKHVESFYKNSLKSIPADTEKARKKYYEALPAKLATARALARGTREPTKEETEHPPPTEVELSAERMKKELRWRHDLEGWEIVKPEAQVVWDDRLRGSLRVFTDPPTSETEFIVSE